MKNTRNAFFTLLFLLLSGCASIPPEAPELSTELGNRISAIEDANLILLHRFFDQKRNEVDRFIAEEWVPVFANEFFSTPNIANAWNVIVQENDKEQRLRFIIKTGPKLQAMINKKRLELIKPLDELERKIEGAIRDEYSQAIAINNSITSFLLSASKVAENRNRYLEIAGMTDKKFGALIEKTDSAVSDLLLGAEDIEEKMGSAEKYLEKLREIHDSI